MTQEQKRIKIAEACGMTGWHEARSLPDYFNDLNTMHEAEKALTPEEQREYAIFLNGGYFPIYEIGGFRVASSTAAQRAESFGKTLNLW